MLPFVVGAGVALAASALTLPLARLAGLDPLPTPAPARGRRGAEGLRAFAALAAALLLVGGEGGDVLVAGALAAAALGRRVPAAGLAFILVAAVPALRAGSSAVDDVAGVHAVLGPAVLSPSPGVAVGAGLAAFAATATAVVLVARPLEGGGWAALRLPGSVADALAPALALLLGVVAVAGPPLVEGEPGTWPATRLGAVLAGLVVAALARRLVARTLLAWAAALAALGGVALALASR